MRKFIIQFYILIVIASPSAAGANYVIKLKNGNEYVTTRYWQKGQQVLFDAYGGVFGIDKSLVAKIDRTAGLRPALQDIQNAPMAPEAPSQPHKDWESPKPPQTEPQPEGQRGLNDPIVTEFNQLKERSKQVDSLLTGEILTLLKEITAFKNKLSKDSKLFINYAREFNEAHEFADVVESALRARTQ